MRMKLALIAMGMAMAVPMHAEARTVREEVVPNRDNCFRVEYIPRLVEHNTKGRLHRGESTSWSGAIAAGSVVRQQKNAAVYFRTTRIVEEEHYTLIPTGCAARTR